MPSTHEGTVHIERIPAIDIAFWINYYNQINDIFRIDKLYKAREHKLQYETVESGLP